MISIQVEGRWSKARPASARPRAVPWNRLAALGIEPAARWGQGAAADVERLAGWDGVPAVDAASVQRWGIADAQDARAPGSPWGVVPPKDAHTLASWDRSLRPLDLVLRLLYNPRPGWRDAAVGSPVRRVDELGTRRDAAGELQASLYIPGVTPLAFNFGGRQYVPATSPLVFFDFTYTEPRHRIQPVDSGGVRVRWQSARRLTSTLRVPWGKATARDGATTGIDYIDYPGPVKPLPEPPPDPTILETYMIANTVNVVTLPDRVPVQAKNIKIGWDADSFSWKLAADVFSQAALDLIKPDAEGAKELELDINGWLWVFVVERYTRNRKFPTEAYSISGASRTQLLAEPYAPLRTGLNGAPISARQAAEAQLEFTGYTLSWDAENVGPVDWTFPTGAFSYQSQTAIQVIARIAETVGAIVRPSRTDHALEVIPRYPVPPWEWDQVDAPISRVIPPAMITDLSGEWMPQPAWNACYVSGTSHGVSMLVRRAGTAGDLPTPDVFEDLLTSEEANRARGVHELSKGGNIEIVGVTVPLFPYVDDHGLGLVLPGQLCRVPEESGPWVGLCLAVDISAEGTGAVRVKQQLKLERHH